MNTSLKMTSLALLISVAYSANSSEKSMQPSQAQAINLQQAAQKAISTHPEVQAAWHVFQASAQEERVSEGRFLPKVDLTGTLANHDNQLKGNSAVDYKRETMGLSLTQMVFDGFATSSDVAKLGYTRLARYYDLLQVSSSIANETVVSYENVLKFRELVRLASDNYVQHKKLYDAIVQKVQAGVARGVDLELATGRLALAESNLLTEATNLHDVSAKYVNIVGELPANGLDSEGMTSSGIPANINSALRLAFEASPQFNSAIEQVLAATAELDGRNAPFLPKVELRARQETGTNVSALPGRDHDRVVEMVATYNLFNGGSDTAAKDQFREKLSAARDNKDKVCRTLRQDLSVAYNDVKQLTERLTYLNQHQLSMSKTREVYKSQFDIGQRSLLDLLNTENEYFQAKRSYVVATHDLKIARSRTLHQTGNLLTELKVQREKLPSSQQLRQGRDLSKNQDLACPAETIEPMTIDKALLMASTIAPSVAIPATAPVVAPKSDESSLVCNNVTGQVNQWATAWSNKDVEGYLSQYSPDFKSSGLSRVQWVDLRTNRIKNAASGISVSIKDLRIVQAGNFTKAVFNQVYDNQLYKDQVEKTLTFDNVGGKCRIVDEQVSKGRLY
jgi:adhesin transport system outer membrane protein